MSHNRVFEWRNQFDSEALSFLMSFFGDDPWALIAIHPTLPEGDPDRIKAVTFTLKGFSLPELRVAAAVEWIERWNQTHNLYFAPNPLKRAMSKKATKADIAEVRRLWSDRDPPKDANGTTINGEALATWRDEQWRQMDQPPGGTPPATWIIDSGRGFQRMWQLTQALPVDGPNGTATLKVEALNRGLAQAYGSDFSVCNIDRILRLPGTVNTRTGQRASVLAYAPERIYPADAFTPVDDKASTAEEKPDDEEEPGAPKAASGLGKGERNKDWTPELGLKKLDLTPHNRNRQKQIREAIEKGFYLDPDGARHLFKNKNGTPGDNSASAWAYYVICELIRSGTWRSTIHLICCNPDYAISAHFLRQGNRAAATVEKFIDKAIADPRTQLAVAAAKADEGAVAERFVGEHQDDLRYDAHARCWYRWVGNVWVKDETQLAFHWAHLLAREMSKDTTASRAAFCGGVETIARRYPQIVVKHDDWDRDPHLVGTPGHTVDLRTGEHYPGRPEQMISNSWAVEPDWGDDWQSRCPRWLSFLAEFTSDPSVDREQLDLDARQEADQEQADFIDYLQRLAGYCATGEMGEDAFFFFWGKGRNGKRVFIETLKRIFASYAATAALTVFMTSGQDQHSTNQAMLAGKRYITGSEADEGQTWNEPLIKSWTGQDPITAHFMRKDNFTFQPCGKLVLQGNSKPRIVNAGPAMRERLQLLRCRFYTDKRDNKLFDKLMEEWPAIARWIVEGAVKWYRQGLKPPATVTKASADYISSQDFRAQWIEECCIEDPNASATPNKLWNSWQLWAERRRLQPGMPRAFSEWLTERYGASKRTSWRDANGKVHTVRLYHGIDVETAASQGPDE
jgi:putative DNA primase/helicase